MMLDEEHTAPDTPGICIVQGGGDALSETFIRAHEQSLPGRVTVLRRTPSLVPTVNERPVLSQAISLRAVRKLVRVLKRLPWHWELTKAYLVAFRRSRADVVLAEYGPMGVAVMAACEIARLPLVVHFHGYDASVRAVLEEHREAYPAMFQKAAAIVAVSTAMRRRLIALGSCPDRTFLNVYGIDCGRFSQSQPKLTPPHFLAVGRFVEKKAPHLTLLAFSEALRSVPTIRLRFIGDGPLLGACRDLAVGLGIDQAVEFLGPQPHDVVQAEMKKCRAFVQHSIEAANGDCEGTPLAILEAGASGVPVIATRHAGIPDVVRESETGLLVDERDVKTMSRFITMLALDCEYAGRLGAAAREHIVANYTIEKSIAGLHDILCNAVRPKHARTSHSTAGDSAIAIA